MDEGDLSNMQWDLLWRFKQQLSQAVLASMLMLWMTGSAIAFQLPREAMLQIQQKYGDDAVARTNAWVKLINEYQTANDLKKLRAVTDFFNHFKPESDMTLWRQENYWATPSEFIGRHAGDCEDYVFAKYFTLKAMGVPIRKLRIIYVTSAKLTQPHMILAYYETADSDPLILDNITDWILYGAERADLMPVYTFNNDGIWFMLNDSHSQEIAPAKKMPLWDNLLAKMQAEHMPKEMLQ